jgi:predicted kinase
MSLSPFFTAETSCGYMPRMIVVAGRPGSGKTTLVHALARSIRCPAICRDEIKEGIVHSAMPGSGTADAVQLQATDAFFTAIELFLKLGVTLVVEAAFQNKIWAPRLQPLLPISKTRLILCSVVPELARSRHIERGLADPARERFHPDAVVPAAREGRQLPIDPFDPPKLEVPTLVVDTTVDYVPGFGEILDFARGAATQTQIETAVK